MLSVFNFPGRYVQGRNATKELGKELKRIQIEGPILIIAGNTAIRELSEIWDRSLSNEGIDYVIEKFSGECSCDEIERLRKIAVGKEVKAIIAAGGGKVMDAGRDVAAQLKLPVATCPTIAATDAPCSAVSVIYNDEGQMETFHQHPRNPDLVLIDTSLIVKAPVRFLISGMGDALSTYIEARTAVDVGAENICGGKSTMTAMFLCKLCHETLFRDGVSALRAAEKGAVTPALERLIEANTLLSGLGFESAGMTTAHSIHNGLTLIPECHHYLHGEKVTFGCLVQLVLEGKEKAEIEELLDFCFEVGLPITLADLGLEKYSDDIITKIAERACIEGEFIHNEPFEISLDIVKDAILAADSIGTKWKEFKQN